MLARKLVMKLEIYYIINKKLLMKNKECTVKLYDRGRLGILFFLEIKEGKDADNKRKVKMAIYFIKVIEGCGVLLLLKK